MTMADVFTDWQKSINIISGFLNHHGVNGEDPESKALDLLVATYEAKPMADAKTIVDRVLDAAGEYEKEYVPNHYRKHGSLGKNGALLTESEFITARIAPLLSTGVDVKKLAEQVCKIVCNANTIPGHDVAKMSILPIGPVSDAITASLTDSAGEIERLNGELNSLSESFGAVSEDYSNAQQKIERLRADVEAEKQRRLYYQKVVYDVCNQLDGATGRSVRNGTGVVCGTYSEPSDEVQSVLHAALSGGAESEKEGE